MRWLIDGDHISLRVLESKAKKKGIPVIIFCDTKRTYESDYSEVRYIDKGADAVDLAIINEAKSDDVIYTDDMGLAYLALGKCKVYNSHGRVYKKRDAEQLLRRHVLGVAKSRTYKRRKR